MTSLEILHQAVLWGRGGMNPTPNNERNFIIGCTTKPKILELYEGDRLKVWVKAGCPSPIDYDTLFPEWATLSKLKQEFIARAMDFLYRYWLDFREIYPNCANVFADKHLHRMNADINTVQVFSASKTANGGRMVWRGDIYQLLRGENEAYIKELMEMTLQFFLVK